jgi:hypothetical protein
LSKLEVSNSPRFQLVLLQVPVQPDDLHSLTEQYVGFSFRSVKMSGLALQSCRRLASSS